MVECKIKQGFTFFIANFTGSYRYVLDYLTEEVLRRQPPARPGLFCEKH
jgi:hypothetical protein